MRKNIYFLLTGIIILLLQPYRLTANELPINTRFAALAKVWGFLKYYHPYVAKGGLDWDLVLIEVIERVENAVSYDDFNDEIKWLIQEAGSPSGAFFPNLNSEKLNHPLFSWINDKSLFTWDNIYRLTLFVSNPFMQEEEQYYVSKNPHANNPEFNNDGIGTPMRLSKKMRLLSLFRYWNIVNYFFPYKDIIGENWDDVLLEFIPKFMDSPYAFDNYRTQPELVAGMLEYHLTVVELVARINDAHAFAISDFINEFWGNFWPPFRVDYIEGKTVVSTVFKDLIGDTNDVIAGDIITEVNGEDTEKKRKRLWKYIHSSNTPSRHRNMNSYFLRGSSETMRLKILREGKETNVRVNRCDLETYTEAWKKARQAEKWNIIDNDIGYINMEMCDTYDVPQAMSELKNTQAIIFDNRKYVKYTAHLFSEYLLPYRKEFATFTVPNLISPGEFYFIEAQTCGPYGPNPDYYKGKVIILVNEVTQSRMEFATMVLQTAPDATIIGSQTAGADGNISYIRLPGGITTRFSGIGVFYPDKTPTQRIGIVPDIEVHPTIEGIREGRDEVLERAIQFVRDNS